MRSVVKTVGTVAITCCSSCLLPFRAFFLLVRACCHASLTASTIRAFHRDLTGKPSCLDVFLSGYGSCKWPPI